MESIMKHFKDSTWNQTQNISENMSRIQITIIEDILSFTEAGHVANPK